MKKILFLVSLTIVVLSQASAQGSSKKEEIEAMKSAYLSRRMNLSPQEAQTFWPVYNQYQNELDALRKSRRMALIDARENFETLNDKEIEHLVDNEIIYKQQELDINKKYHSQFKQLLSIRKVAQLYRSEEEFKRMLLKRLKEKN